MGDLFDDWFEVVVWWVFDVGGVDVGICVEIDVWIGGEDWCWELVLGFYWWRFGDYVK